MKTQTKTWFTLATALLLAQAVPGFAQEQPSRGWRKIGENPPADAPPPGSQQQAPDPDQQPAPPVPSRITLPAGTWITVRVNQPISTDHNQPGDAFTATLVQPLVADGLVVARRGQMVAGRVVESQKGGRVKGTARLGIELTEVSLVNGQQVPIKTQFTERQADTSVGRDAGAIATTTGVGAAIGAVADGGFGAGMGAIAGAAASTIGVLVTRGNSATLYPEDVLTFRLEAPVAISTARSEHAFQPVTPDTYEPRHGFSDRGGPPQRVAMAPPYYARYYPYSPYGYGYGYPGYPGYYAPYFGSSFFFFSGPRYYSRGYGYGYRGYRHR